MATSKFETTQYDARAFVESAGAVLFRISERKICFIKHQGLNEWLLAKGRRRVGEHRLDAALREAQEETGYTSQAVPLQMTTRATPRIEVLPHYEDQPRAHEDASEPFMITIRSLGNGKGVKVIHWYIAAITGTDQSGCAQPSSDQSLFHSSLFDFDDAIIKLEYQEDREIVKEAITIFNENYGEPNSLANVLNRDQNEDPASCDPGSPPSPSRILQESNNSVNVLGCDNATA